MLENKNKKLIQYYVLKCFQCGVCTGSCPVSSITPFNPRRIAYKIVRGIGGIDEIWYCLICHICEARCPSLIEFTKVVTKLREESIRARRDILNTYREMLKQFLDSGLVIKPISNEVEVYREKLKQDLDKEGFHRVLREIFMKTGFQGVGIDED
ncbi:MAG: 4Fe-4S dicluster domain-containing protein [Candidatus Methanomethylicia archaeon]